MDHSFYEQTFFFCQESFDEHSTPFLIKNGNVIFKFATFIPHTFISFSCHINILNSIKYNFVFSENNSKVN